MTLENVVLVAAGTLVALFAGAMYAFSVAVNLGLGRLKDRDYLAAFQHINSAIQNPVFGLTFVLPIILLPVATIQAEGKRFTLLMIASILFIVGGIGITVAFNIPLNNRLDKVDLATADAAEVRGWFEKPWNRWHTIRTLALVASVVLLFAACLS